MRNIFILFLFLPLLSYCQTERDLVSILIYNTKFDGVTDQDFKNDIEQDFKDLITDRIKICPKHLTRRSSRVNEAYLILEDNKQLRENLFKKYNFTEDSLPIPFGTDAIIFSSFENQGGVAYMNMGIYAGGREVNHDRLRNKKFLVEDIKGDGKREEFLNTLIEAVLNPNTISELVSSVLGIKENDVNCFGEVITGVVNVSYHEKITQEKLVSPSHIIMNNSSISTSKINWITQRSYLGLFNSRKNGSIDSSEKSIGFSFKRAGKYSIRLIAEGTRKSDTLDIRTIQLAPRKPKTYQSVALGAGLASLSVSLFSHLESENIYERYKINSDTSRELEYERASALRRIAVLTFYSGAALTISSLIDYHFSIGDWSTISPIITTTSYVPEVGVSLRF